EFRDIEAGGEGVAFVSEQGIDLCPGPGLQDLHDPEIEIGNDLAQDRSDARVHREVFVDKRADEQIRLHLLLGTDPRRGERDNGVGRVRHRDVEDRADVNVAGQEYQL